MSIPRSRRKTGRQHGPHLVQRGGVYYASLGGRRRVSLGTRDRAEAERAFAQLLSGERPDVRRAARAAEVPLTEITEQYLNAPHGWTRQTLRTARSRVELVGSWFEEHGITLASEITPALVDRYLSERRGQVTHRTINRDWRAWRLAIGWGQGRALCGPCEAVTERPELREARRARRRVLPAPDEVSRVLERLRQRDASEAGRTKSGHGSEPRNRGASLAVLALYVTGLRIAELQRLTEDDIHDGAVWVRPEAGAADTAEPTKGHRERAIRLSPDALAAVRAYLAWTRGRTRTFSESWLLKTVHAACVAADVPPFGLHDLRRAAATEWHHAGVPVRKISAWLGHSDVRTTELYLGEYRSDAAFVAPLPRGASTEH